MFGARKKVDRLPGNDSKMSCDKVGSDIVRLDSVLLNVRYGRCFEHSDFRLDGTRNDSAKTVKKLIETGPSV